MGLFRNPNDAAIFRRLERIEQKLDALIAHLEVEMPEQDDATYSRLIADGKKIMAIKEYRERTGAGLSEAKTAIDEIEQRMRKA